MRIPIAAAEISIVINKEYLKILLALAVNNGFKLASVDFRAAFFQSRKLDRDVFMKHLPDIAASMCFLM